MINFNIKFGGFLRLRTFRNTGIYTQIVCTNKKQVKSLLSKKDYSKLKDHTKFLFTHHDKVIVYDNINSFQGGGIRVGVYAEDIEYNIPYDPMHQSKDLLDG